MRMETYPDSSTTGFGKHFIVGLMKWASSGFHVVDQMTYDKRCEVCFSCPHVLNAPHAGIYGLAARISRDHHVCSLCGCIVKNKAHLITEVCPSPDPSNASVFRWGDPME